MKNPYLPKKDVVPMPYLEPSLIGKLVGIQVLDRTGKDTVDAEGLQKYVGILEAYAIIPKMDYAMIRIKGLSMPSINTKKQSYEVYLYD